MTTPLGVPFVRLYKYSPTRLVETEPFPQELMDRLTSMEFTDDTDGDDVVEIKFDNRKTLDLLDSDVLAFGRYFTLIYGYPGGETSPRKIMRVETIRGGEEIMIKAVGNYTLLQETVNFAFFRQVGFTQDVKDRLSQDAGFASQYWVDDDVLMREILEFIALKNGIRVDEIVVEGTLPKKGMFHDGGYLFGPGTWMDVLEDLASLIPAKVWVDDGRITFRTEWHIETPALELVYGGVAGTFPPEHQREIHSDTLDLDADILYAPKEVISRGYDVEGKDHVTFCAGDATAREVEATAGINPLEGQTLVEDIESRGHDLEEVKLDGERRYLEVEGKILEAGVTCDGAPDVVAGRYVVMTLPSKRFTGMYSVTEKVDRLVTGQFFTTDFTLGKRSVGSVSIPLVEEVPERGTLAVKVEVAAKKEEERKVKLSNQRVPRQGTTLGGVLGSRGMPR